MGIPDREAWPGICLQISQGFLEVQKVWFNNCVNRLSQAAEHADFADHKIVLKRTELDGFAVRATTAYQLYVATTFLAEHQYVPVQHGKDFADLLFSQACGPQMPTCMRFFERYFEVAENPSTQLFRVCSDVSRYITDEEAPLVESTVIATLFPVLVHLTQMVVADAFGDQQAVAELQAQLDEYVRSN